MIKTRVLASIYFALAVAGLIGTWSFNLAYDGGNYLGDWFANDASSSAAVDIIAVLFVSFLLFFTEGRRIGLPWWLLILLVPLSIGGAVAFTLPLFLGIRELKLGSHRRTSEAASEPATNAPGSDLTERDEAHLDDRLGATRTASADDDHVPTTSS